MTRDFFDRLISWLLVAVLIVAFGATMCGCGNNITEDTTNTIDPTMPETEMSVETSASMETTTTTLDNYTIDGFYNLWSELEMAEKS